MSPTRIAKPVNTWHTLTIKAHGGRNEMILMGRGRYIQLSVWTDSEPGNFAWFGGRKTLRKLARTILRETT